MLDTLENFHRLPLAETNEELCKRLNTLLKLAKNGSYSRVEIAESIVDVIGDTCFGVSDFKPIEPKLISWIKDSFDETDISYIDAITTVLANMTSEEAYTFTKSLVANCNNFATKNILSESLMDN